MYVITITQDEWTWLYLAVKNGAGVPSSLRFALDSATLAQQHMVVARDWREQETGRMQVTNPPLTVGQEALHPEWLNGFDDDTDDPVAWIDPDAAE
jgi:hypothetical protein